MLTLQDLLDAFAEGGQEAVAALFAANPDVQVADLRAAAADAFQALYASEGRTADDVAQMQVLADVIDLVRAEETSRAEAAAASAAEADALAARALGVEATTEEVEEAAAAEVAEVEAPAALEGEVIPAQPVAASAARRRVDLAAISRRAPSVQPPPAPVAESRAMLVAAADVPGFVTGSELDFAGGAQALLARSSAMPTEYVPNRHIRHQFAMVRKPASPFVADGRDDQAVIDAAADESRLPGGSLVAAGGWCAPSEVWYDLCPGLESGAGIIQLPSVRAMRGGVRWTQGPQFCDFYSGTGFFSLTEAQDIAGFEKPCFEIPCPDFEECRLDAHGLCLTAGILQNRGYPEYVARFIQGSLVAHAHRMNALKIQRMVELSTPVTVNEGSPAVGATAGVLDALELHVESYRYRFRMDPSRSLEAVLPLWLRGVIRSDLAKRNGVDMIDVSDGQINAWFGTRGVQPQWVYDWQDALCGTDDAQPATPIGGDPAAVTAWPDQVQILLYPAGTFVELEQDVITLESVYDSTMFRRNRYTALFTEEAWCVINRCYESLVLTLDICPNGSTAGQATAACPVA